MKETSPIVYNELAKTHSPANSDVVISPKHIKVDEDSKNLLKNSAAGLSVTVADIVSEDAGNKLREGADGRLYGAATEASELISARDDNQITLGADDKLYVAPPTGQDVLSKEEDNLLRHGNDKGVYLNGRDVLSNDGQNHLTVSDVDKRVTFIPDYKEWVSGDRNNALSTADDGKIFLDKKDLCHCEMTIPEGVTVVSQDPDNVLSTGSEGGAYLGSDDVCKAVNQQIEGGCIEVVSNTGGNLLTEGLDHRSYLGCNTIEDAIQRKCIRVVSPNRDNVLSTDSAGRAFLGCEAADRLITQGCMGLKSGQEGNLLTEDDEHRLVLDKLAVNSTAEQGITDGGITVVSKDEGNVLTEGTDKRAFLDCTAVDGKITDGCINVTSADDANLLTKGNDNRSYLGKAAVNSTVEQGITDSVVTVVSGDDYNLLVKGGDNRAYLGAASVNVAVEAGITAGDVTVVSTDEDNMISAGTDGRAVLKCETVDAKITDGCIDVVSTDRQNLLTTGSDNRAMLNKDAVNSTVQQGITEGVVTVVSRAVDNLLVEGEDKRAYLSKDAVCTATNDNIASGCVDLVSPDEGNLITKDASGKVFLNCEAIKDCIPESVEPACVPVETGVEQLSLSSTTYYPTRPGKYRFYLKNSGGGGGAAGMLVLSASINDAGGDPDAVAAANKKWAFIHAHIFSGCAGELAQTRTESFEVDVTQEMIEAGAHFTASIGKGGEGRAIAHEIKNIDVSTSIQAVDFEAGTYAYSQDMSAYLSDVSIGTVANDSKGQDGGETVLQFYPSSSEDASQSKSIRGGFGGKSAAAESGGSPAYLSYNTLARSAHGRVYDGQYLFYNVDSKCISSPAIMSVASATLPSVDIMKQLTSVVGVMYGGSSMAGVTDDNKPVLNTTPQGGVTPSSGGNFYSVLGTDPFSTNGANGENGAIIAELDGSINSYYENTWLTGGKKSLASSLLFIEELGIVINYLGAGTSFLSTQKTNPNVFAVAVSSSASEAVQGGIGRGDITGYYKVVDPTHTLYNSYIYNIRDLKEDFQKSSTYNMAYNSDPSYTFSTAQMLCVSVQDNIAQGELFAGSTDHVDFAKDPLDDYFSTEGSPRYIGAYGSSVYDECCGEYGYRGSAVYHRRAVVLNGEKAYSFVVRVSDCCGNSSQPYVYKSGLATFSIFFAGIDDSVGVYADTLVKSVDDSEHSGDYSCDFLDDFGVVYLGSGVVLMELKYKTLETSCPEETERTVINTEHKVGFVVQLKDSCGNVIVESDTLSVLLQNLGDVSNIPD